MPHAMDFLMVAKKAIETLGVCWVKCTNTRGITKKAFTPFHQKYFIAEAEEDFFFA